MWVWLIWMGDICTHLQGFLINKGPKTFRKTRKENGVVLGKAHHPPRALFWASARERSINFVSAPLLILESTAECQKLGVFGFSLASDTLWCCFPCGYFRFAEHWQRTVKSSIALSPAAVRRVLRSSDWVWKPGFCSAINQWYNFRYIFLPLGDPEISDHNIRNILKHLPHATSLW